MDTLLPHLLFVDYFPLVTARVKMFPGGNMSTGQFMEGPVSPVSPAAAGDSATEGKKLEILKSKK